MTQSNQGVLNELALFAGAGGGILGGGLLGWRTVCAVEWEPYPACVLVSRQNDGILPPFPIWDDVQTFDGKPWRGIVDVISGGFPCQDISAAGRGAGIDGERSGMWKEFARIIGEVRPKYAYIENSPMLTTRGLDTVLCDLAAMGYDAEWGCLSAADCGAPHERQRIWIVANAKGGRQEKETVLADTSQLQRNGIDDYAGLIMESGQVPEFGNNGGAHYLADTDSTQCKGSGISSGISPQNNNIGGFRGNAEVSDTTSERQQRQGQSWFGSDPAEAREGETDHAFAERVGHIWGIESPLDRVANGVAARVDRLKAIGNGQVPAVAATAFRVLSGAAVK